MIFIAPCGWREFRVAAADRYLRNRAPALAANPTARCQVLRSQVRSFGKSPRCFRRATIASNCSPAKIHRLEIPHGRFERRIQFGSAPVELEQWQLDDGCLSVVLIKSAESATRQHVGNCGERRGWRRGRRRAGKALPQDALSIVAIRQTVLFPGMANQRHRLRVDKPRNHVDAARTYAAIVFRLLTNVTVVKMARDRLRDGHSPLRRSSLPGFRLGCLRLLVANR